MVTNTEIIALWFDDLSKTWYVSRRAINERGETALDTILATEPVGYRYPALQRAIKKGRFEKLDVIEFGYLTEIYHYRA